MINFLALLTCNYVQTLHLVCLNMIKACSCIVLYITVFGDSTAADTTEYNERFVYIHTA